MPAAHSTHVLRGVAVAALMGVCLCTLVDEQGMKRSNPADAGGECWTVSAPPVIDSVALDSSPGWSDFDFGDSSGALDVVVHAHDRNEPYDTLRYGACVEDAAGIVDTAAVTVDSFFTVRGLERNRSYTLVVWVADTWDSTALWSRSLRTPPGAPPPRPDSVEVVQSAHGVRVIWQLPRDLPASWRYVVYHSSDPHTSPFTALHDTVASVGTMSCGFWHATDDYRMQYYLVAVANEYGESRAADTLSGRAGSLTAVPSGVGARYVTCDSVQVGWRVSSSYDIDYCDVYRRDSSSSYYRLVRTVDMAGGSHAATCFDTLQRHRACWYRVATMTADGVGSVLSDSARADVITNCRTPD